MEVKGEKIKEQLADKPQPQPFRGVAIHITEAGKYGLELVGGVAMLEVYGALTLILAKMEKDLSV